MRSESRSMMSLAGSRINRTEELLAHTVDRLGILIWQKTKDGAKGVNMPESLYQKLTEGPVEKPNMGFRSSEDFQDYWKRAVEERTDVNIRNSICADSSFSAGD